MVVAAGYGPTLFDDVAFQDTRHPSGGFWIPRKHHGGTVTWTDMFAGAGGSSNGIHFVPGHEVIYALNHNELAIQAHEANHPNTDHAVAAIEEVHPSRFARTDCLWASPSCTHHAYCRGAKAMDDDARRSRATMRSVVEWSAYHRYDYVVVENVVEVKLWCEYHSNIVVDKKTGKPVEKGCSCGQSFNEWAAEMEALGYERQEVYLNSQFVGAPQSRDRLYVVFNRKGTKAPDLEITPLSWCGTCEEPVHGVQTWKTPSRGSNRDRYQQLHRWGRYDQQYILTCPACTSKVAPAVIGSETIIDWSLPIERIGDRSTPLKPKTIERIRGGMERVGRNVPLQVPVGGHLFERRPGSRVWSLSAPLRTVTTTPTQGMLLPAGGQTAAERPTAEPSHTLTTSDRLAMVFPAANPAPSRPVGDAAHTITTVDRLAVVRAGGQAPSPRDGGEPMMAVTAHDRQIAMVCQNMENNVARPLGTPAPAVTTGGNQMLVTARNNGAGEPLAVPAATVAASGRHHGLLVYNGVPGFVRELADAAGTLTTRDKQSLLVPLRDGSLAHDIANPTPALATRADQALVDTRPNVKVTLEEILAAFFRMLKWPELAIAQGLHQRPDGTPYTLEARVRTPKGTYKEIPDETKVGFIGNAVSCPAATFFGVRIGDALAVSGA